MIAQKEKDSAPAETELFVKMVIDAWGLQNARVDKLLGELTDEQLKAEIAPGKNSGIYVLGHLTAVNDGLQVIFGFGERLYPQLEDIFIKNPENADSEKPSAAELRQYWQEVNAGIRENFKELNADDWFSKHTAVSAEDFAKEPHRNKLNVLMNRTIHQSYHLGQLTFLKEK